MELDYSFNTSGQTDNNGNVLEQTIKIGSTTVADQTYTYDQVNRIASAAEAPDTAPATPKTWSRTFSYDHYGNMWVPPSWMGIMPGNQTPQSSTAFNASNQLTIGSSAYDGAGNLKVDPDGNLITYDAENRMTQFTAHNGNTVANYSYDGDGKRISKSVTQAGVAGGAAVTTTYVYNAMGQLIAEYGGPAPTTTGTSYLTTDHLGSTRVITDSASPTPNVLERDDYLPFGEQIGGNIGSGRSGQGVVGYSSSTDIHQRFTSKERDVESNLDFFEARYFSSGQGRFTSPDEFTGGPTEAFGDDDLLPPDPLFYAEPTEPQSLNKYAYALNNPLRYVDPDGHQTTTADALKAITAASAATGQEEIALPAGAALLIYAVVDKTVGWDNVGKAVKSGAKSFMDAAAKYGAKSPNQWDGDDISGRTQQQFLQKNGPPNPDGQQGAPDHQAEVDKQAEQARQQAKPGDTVETGKKIKGADSSRRPDVQVVRGGKTVEVTEVERRPNSRRHRERQAEYDRLKIPHKTVPLPKRKK